MPRQNTNTQGDCFSITIRTGNGVNLGLNSVQGIVTKLHGWARYHTLSIEMEDDSAHIQGVIFTHTPKRQDHIREGLLPLVLQMWREQEELKGNVPTIARENNVKKHALKVKVSTSYENLVNYCLKDVKELISHVGPKSLKQLGYHCEHDNPPGCPKCYDEVPIEICIGQMPTQKDLQIIDFYKSSKKKCDEIGISFVHKDCKVYKMYFQLFPSYF